VNTLAAVLSLYPQLVPGPDFTIVPATGGGTAIGAWTTTVAPQPTVDQLTAASNALDRGAAQSAQIQKLSVPYQAALQVPVSYMGTTFEADLSSQTIVAHAMLVYSTEGATPSGFYFVDSNNNQVPMTLTQLQGLGSAIAASYLLTFQKWTALKAQVLAATTVTAVQAVVW
jgi:Domain of unknown function (DUF4376)